MAYQMLPNHAKDEIMLQLHYEQYKIEWTTRRARACADKRGSCIMSPRESDCSQGRHFRLRNPYRYNLLVYIIPHELSFTNQSSRRAEREHIRNRARGALSLEFHELNPEVLFEERLYFMECFWSEDSYPQQDLENHLDRLIADHRALCEWIETENDRLRSKNRSAGRRESDDYTSAQLSSPTSDLDIPIPSMRAIILLFWPDRPRSTEVTERAAVVLTGDDTHLKSGPVSLHSFLDHSLPSYPATERIIHVPMPKAAEILTELDKREIAANSALQARNEHYAAQNRAVCWEEARERVRLTRGGQEGEVREKAESYRGCERRMEEFRQTWSQEGFNERHAMLGAMLLTPW